ncbi:M23 family metallopeptidase [Terracidiphilus gabretensis]|uniref:M23 family metallopeptidase n=1 Tax=Terracidiphilus gabretensis TaxID=1577687 RepID=UPI00071BE493|nr:M23 family metallopeptidase [Terracidiphilus gabretensis]
MPDWAMLVLYWAELMAPGLVVVSVLLPVSFRFCVMRWAMSAFVLLVGLSLADGLGQRALAGLIGLAIDIAAVVFVARGWSESLRFKAAWLKRFKAGESVMLKAPFEGRWKALETGPWAARNHHLAARDQWFAVDWVRVDRASWGSRILSPVDGVVAYVEDGHRDKPARRWIQRDLEHPAGNYVAIRILNGAADYEKAFVILAHLEMGSAAVRVGDMVRSGDLIGRCGNSGNTTIPHLHLHVQPEERFRAGGFWGIPVRWSGFEAWMRPGEVAGEGI